MDIAHLDAALGNAQRAFVDSSMCIAYLSTTELVHVQARHIFERIRSNTDPLVGYLSVVSVAELLIRPIRSGSSDLFTVHSFLLTFPNLYIIDVDFGIAQQAANVRALSRLAMPDALLVGTAIMSGCEAILTNDARWSRRMAPLFGQFSWIYLGG
jgi:predicted nucleic acid-binding protein